MAAQLEFRHLPEDIPLATETLDAGDVVANPWIAESSGRYARLKLGDTIEQMRGTYVQYVSRTEYPSLGNFVGLATLSTATSADMKIKSYDSFVIGSFWKYPKRSNCSADIAKQFFDSFVKDIQRRVLEYFGSKDDRRFVTVKYEEDEDLRIVFPIRPNVTVLGVTERLTHFSQLVKEEAQSLELRMARLSFPDSNDESSSNAVLHDSNADSSSADARVTSEELERSVFLCHSSEDKEFVTTLAKDLEARGITTWFDKDAIHGGDDFIDAMPIGINQCRFVVTVLSPRFGGAKWAQEEYKIALQREVEEQRVVIIPIMMEQSDVPAFLKKKHIVDFTENYTQGLEYLLEAIKVKLGENTK